MNTNSFLNRRRLLSTGLMLPLAAGLTGFSGAANANSKDLQVIDPVSVKLVMNLVVTCTDPVLATKENIDSKDGKRPDIWPIVGGKFEGPGIRGTVVPGGGDFPLVRPDGTVVIDALYRLLTDDGITIIIHNKGLYYPPAHEGEPDRYRLVPEFTAPVGKYDWLNKAIFLATLVDAPADMRLAGKGENDRLIQVFRVD